MPLRAEKVALPRLYVCELLGALLALLLDQPRSHAVLTRALAWRGAPLAWALALGGALAWGEAPVLLLGGLFAVLVGACVVREDHVLQPLLSWRPLAYLGTISYGMYMLHMLCKNAVLKVLGLWGPTGDGGLVFAFTLLAAVLVLALNLRESTVTANVLLAIGGIGEDLQASMTAQPHVVQMSSDRQPGWQTSRKPSSSARSRAGSTAGFSSRAGQPVASATAVA